jgi:hypothetical protein
MRTIRIIEHITLDGVIQAGCPTHSRVSNEWPGRRNTLS